MPSASVILFCESVLKFRAMQQCGPFFVLRGIAGHELDDKRA